MSPIRLHETLRLYISNGTLILEPYYQDPSSKPELLVIDRITGKVRLDVLENGNALVPSEKKHALTVYGVFGFIRLISGERMVVITQRQRVGRLGEHDIYRATAVKIIPVTTPEKEQQLSTSQMEDEKAYLQLLENHLQGHAFHFSYTYDLTQTLQRQLQLTSQVGLPLWKRADERFFWNRYMQTKLIEETENGQYNFDAFILPVMHGFAEAVQTSIKGKSFIFALISRRSRYRAGTRYFSRGVDLEGNVSNFVETEQLVLLDGPSAGGATITGKIKMSYVQIRGSIPIFWAQMVNMKYVPKMLIQDKVQTPSAFKRHVDKVLDSYGPTIMINLVNTKGHEMDVANAFEKQVNRLKDERVRYLHFDFHKECKRMRWDRIQLLINQIESDLLQQGYCYVDETAPGEKVRRLQQSVCRTNCMDCLDRTNVVQSMLARHALNRQLREVGVLGQDEDIVAFETFYFLFRNVWADNADAVSIAYSGTGALKTDFTRTGNRTKAGALQDLVNSIVRYVKNNYLDGARQDAYDLALGNFVPPTAEEYTGSPFVREQALRFRIVPYIFALGILMLVFGTILRVTSGFSLFTVFTFFWLAVVVTAYRFMFDNGVQFVNWPKLVPLDFLEAAAAAAPGIKSPAVRSTTLTAKAGEILTKLEREKTRID
ncbi:uncharacterized protein VTP21DRAFT_2343 [Calcarisporiella thermophila]|uniref:uncharacterized protein n=1 Tax=Calcarisporiella thermophila TaxID=911321 RepID=UPI003743A390